LLRLVTYPDAGTALARLLVGPRLALGAKDIHALGRYSREIARRTNSKRSDRLEEILEFGSEANLDANDFAIGSIIEALELIDEADPSEFSSEGLARLKEFARELKAVRRTMTGSITDKIQIAERFLRLDVETLVRDGWQNGRRHLDKFMDEAAALQELAEQSPLFSPGLKPRRSVKVVLSQRPSPPIRVQFKSSLFMVQRAQSGMLLRFLDYLRESFQIAALPRPHGLNIPAHFPSVSAGTQTSSKISYFHRGMMHLKRRE